MASVMAYHRKFMMGKKHEKRKITDRWGRDLNTKTALYHHVQVRVVKVWNVDNTKS